MGKAIRASALILLLACTAHAGWMPNDSPAPPPQAGWMGNNSPAPPPQAGWMGNDSPAPPSQPSGVAQETTTGGEITTMSAGSLTQIALDLLAVLPSLF